MHDSADCEAYARPMLIMHAAFLALGVLAVAFAAELIFTSSAVFWLAGTLATLALLPDADLFSFVMTESVTFSLYSIAALALVLALKAPRTVEDRARGIAVRAAVPDPALVRRAGPGRDRTDRGQ